jgi:hypothetical protein
MTNKEAVARIASVLESQSKINDAMSRALESLAFQADKYDWEIAQLRNRCDELERRRLHSVKVDP